MAEGGGERRAGVAVTPRFGAIPIFSIIVAQKRKFVLAANEGKRTFAHVNRLLKVADSNRGASRKWRDIYGIQRMQVRGESDHSASAQHVFSTPHLHQSLMAAERAIFLSF